MPDRGYSYELLRSPAHRVLISRVESKHLPLGVHHFGLVIMPASRLLKARKGRPKAATSSPEIARREPDFLVVGVGASAGGLDACRHLLRALATETSMAFVVIQHLDPTHKSMMVELLASHTSMSVTEAHSGAIIEPNNVYVISPGTNLTVDHGALEVSQATTRRGGRMPLDIFLTSLADAYGTRAAGIILSGTGADGSVGVKAIKEGGGLVIVQEPKEAGYDGMPRNAVLTGCVDSVLAIDSMPHALAEYAKQVPEKNRTPPDANKLKDQDCVAAIIQLLREKTKHDFRHYKKGTLQRRIERRMLIASVETSDMGQYLESLRKNEHEIELLAKDLLINVTRFFRDTEVFDVLKAKTIPELLHAHKGDKPVRIWIAGCSTGEETYSLTMLFREAIAESKHNIKLQVFVSDVDAEAVASAREGLYPETITNEVSADRLEKFFSHDEHGYRVLPEIRSSVVFAVQDVLTDPPFSRLDFISCRNLLIYLSADAQSKVIALFHFALRPDGILLLGSSETTGSDSARFDMISKQERLFRRVGRSYPGELSFLIGTNPDTPSKPRASQSQSSLRQSSLADLCRRLVMETFAPAAVLVNQKHECLYHVGPTDRYLRVPVGHPSHDVLSMASPGLRTKLRSALQQALRQTGRISVAGCRSGRGDSKATFSLDVQKVVQEGETMLLVCFIDEQQLGAHTPATAAPSDVSRIAQLEHELEATRTELQGAIQDLEVSTEEQKAINEEALSVNEECQSTNEELLTSKEELQSLNEELTALNTQLHETLEQQRTTSNDLQNVLYSTDVATIFLDTDLNIRFYTPATKSLFSVIPSDVGRPLADLRSLAGDSDLMIDARTVLRTLTPMEREIESHSGDCFDRKILPYRTHDHGVEGVVITFTDITDQKHTARALESAKHEAESATAAKSRFLAAASHDLRQPLQTLKLLQGLLLETVDGAGPRKLTMRIGETVGAMSGMLNALLDINQIETGAVQAHPVSFRIGDLLDRLRDEFSYHANAQGLTLRSVPCHLTIQSDPRLLEQILRNLLSNALKYTSHGRILLGCRRHKGWLTIQVCDTGAGIPDEQMQAIFQEYHQLDNPARERSRGLGLGLSIVQRLSTLLSHKVRVQSTIGKGSIFSIDVALTDSGIGLPGETDGSIDGDSAADGIEHKGMILLVEDDPELRELLGTLIKAQGHHVATAVDGVAALNWLEHGGVQPDVILADFNLPRGMTGLELIVKLREKMRRDIPAIILTGDISAQTSQDVMREHCTQLNKPVKLKEVTYVIQRLLSQSPTKSISLTSPDISTSAGKPVVYVVDDDEMLRDTIRTVLEADDHEVEDFATCEAFLASYNPGREACLLIDANLPGMKGLELLQHLRKDGDDLAAIMITGSNDVALAVEAMKAGASDFIEKPFSRAEMLDSVARSLEHSRDANKLIEWRQDASDQIADLTPRQRQIMELVLAGHPSKNIAADLGISQRTVENHRAEIMRRTDSKSIPALARLAIAASPA